MHLTIYVHDFYSQIGHSRAMQELLNGLSPSQKKSIDSIEIVAFSCGDLNEMFSTFTCSKYFTKIPFPRLKPFLIKVFFYHIASLLHSLSKGRNRKKIGIGIACLNVDIVNVQFIHEQWRIKFLENRSLSFMSRFYKKLLFSYFLFFEKHIYSPQKKVSYIVIASFLKTFLSDKFGTPLTQMTIIPSGVNTDEFQLAKSPISGIFDELSSRNPSLKVIDINQPIVLFIGALERKGLYRALKALEETPNVQLIVVGQSENKNFQMPKVPFPVAHIPFSREIHLFYQIADFFIFPTHYEPFGLVIIEAYSMGLDIYVPIENVGASEIIEESDGIHFFHQDKDIKVCSVRKITAEEKKQRRMDRLKLIDGYTWEKSAEKFFPILSSPSPYSQQFKI